MFHHSPSTAPTATTLKAWEPRLVGPWSCGEASAAANALISVVCLLFTDVFDDFFSVLPEKCAFNTGLVPYSTCTVRYRYHTVLRCPVWYRLAPMKTQ